MRKPGVGVAPDAELAGLAGGKCEVCPAALPDTGSVESTVSSEGGSFILPA